YFVFNSKIKTFENDESILFEATFFETDADRLASVPTYITDKILNSEFAESYQSTLPLSGNPTVQNHTGLTETCLQTLQNEFGAEHIRPFYGQIPYFNEDFIYFQRKVPGVMFLLGASNQEKGTLAMPHSPEFVVDESAIKYGVTYFSNLLAKRTGSKSTSTSGLHTPWLANASNTNNH
ncbi:MAG: M20/M25/M40 family metallo-hydrolase, partial [Bacteroidota bacterium]